MSKQPCLDASSCTVRRPSSPHHTSFPRVCWRPTEKPGANDKIAVAGIGIGRQGSAFDEQFGQASDVRIIGIADVNLPRAQANTKRSAASSPARTTARCLERKDVDAIVTATPDHWRALVSIHAAQAGKDIYAEKPMTLTILEGRRMAQAVRKYERVFQTGSQQRSQSQNRYGCELVRNGRIGKITKVVGHNYPSPWNCQLPGQPVPEGWTGTCGAAPPNRFPTTRTSTRPRQSRLDLVSALLRRRNDRLGRPRSRPDPMGPGHGRKRPDRHLGRGPGFDPPTYTEPTPRGPGEKQCSQPIIHYRYANGIEVVMDNGNPGGGIFYGDKGKIEIFRGRVTSNPAEIVTEPIRTVRHLYKRVGSVCIPDAHNPGSSGRTCHSARGSGIRLARMLRQEDLLVMFSSISCLHIFCLLLLERRVDERLDSVDLAGSNAMQATMLQHRSRGRWGHSF